MPKTILSIHNELIPIIIVLLAVPFVIQKAELWTVGQDQGVYQAEAIELIQGNYEVQHDFEEYYILETVSDKKAYRNMVYNDMLGFYAFKSTGLYPTIPEDRVISAVSGVYHGVQTFPAIIALWGKLFGIENMLGVHTLMFICSVFMLYLSIGNLGIPKTSNVCGTVLLTFSPLTLWIAKTSYVEMTLLLILSLYLYIMTSNDNMNLKWYLGVVLTYFSFMHVSFLIIYPAFVLGHFILYLYYKNKNYLLANIITSIGLCIGNTMMAFISPPYYYGNCARLFWGNIITVDNFLVYIWAGSMVIILLTIFFPRISLWWEANINDSCKRKILRIFVRGAIIVSLLAVIAHAIKIGYLITPASNFTGEYSYYGYYGKGIESFTRLTIWAFLMATGFLAIPYIIGTMLKNPSDYWKDPRMFVMQMLFIYTVCFTFAFFRKEVPYYYYYSRYLVFYIPIIMVILAWKLQKAPLRKQIIFLTISLILMLPSDWSLIKNKDDTIIEWETLLDLQEVITENSAVILSDSSMPAYIGPQFRAMTNSAIFPCFDDMSSEIELLKNNYDNVFILSWSKLNESFIGSDHQVEPVYIDRYMMSKSQANSSLGGGWYPVDYQRSQFTMYLYKIIE